MFGSLDFVLEKLLKFYSFSMKNVHFELHSLAGLDLRLLVPAQALDLTRSQPVETPKQYYCISLPTQFAESPLLSNLIAFLFFFCLRWTQTKNHTELC